MDKRQSLEYLETISEAALSEQQIYYPSSLRILKTQRLAIGLLGWKVKLQLSYLQSLPILFRKFKVKSFRRMDLISVYMNAHSVEEASFNM